MFEIALTALHATNPLGFLAALGAFRSIAMVEPGATLRWDVDDIIPSPVLSLPDDWSGENVISSLETQRLRWLDSKLLNFPLTAPASDVKEIDLAAWARFISAIDQGASNPRLFEEELLTALVAEGAVDGKRNNKPTHLHFTAGQQQFLDIVREVGGACDEDRFREALFGPWRFDSPAKTLRWDPRGERIYAVRGFNPSGTKDPTRTVPGAEWLAFLGLSFLPVVNRYGHLLTTACNRDWKRSAFRWPIWIDALTLSEITQIMLLDVLSERRRSKVSPSDLRDVGVHTVYESPIRRTDQGGYGSFAAPTAIVQAPGRVDT